MEKLIPRIKQIAARIAETEDKRKRIATFLRGVGPQTGLFSEVKPDSLENIKIAAVDGGLLKKSLHGFDCAMVRSAGVCFHYKEGKISKVEYWPSKRPSPIPEVMESLSDLDWFYATSILRVTSEVERVIECLDRFKPDILLMDGSIVPHYSDKPASSSPIYSSYLNLTRLFTELYQKAANSSTVLAGVIEDSRSSAFCNFVKSDLLSKVKHNLVPELVELLDRTRDTNLLYLVLKKGEKSRLIKYSATPQQHPVLKDLGPQTDNIWSFYIRTAQHDRPIKVDFLNKENADKLASVLLPISGHHSGYGLPAPLVEADNVAKLSEEEIENLYTRITALTGNTPGAMRLRREQRPF